MENKHSSPNDQQVTLGISSAGNHTGLLLTLSSVLLGSLLPSRIRVLLNGNPSGSNSFYLQQVAELATLKGVDFSLHFNRQHGVRASRDWHLKTCPTPLLWMLDDDVLVEHDCLFLLLHAYRQMQSSPKSLIKVSDCLKDAVYACGSKPDLNNLRGYKDFSTKILYGSDPLPVNASMNFFYDKDTFRNKYFPTQRMDTGNCLLDISRFAVNKLEFTQFEDSVNSAGEDTIMGLKVHKLGLKALFVPAAIVTHLEKPDVKFNEEAARTEMVLRACDVLELDKQIAKQTLFPWLHQKG